MFGSKRKARAKPLAGQVILITGGARGIGRALAAATAHRGCKVAIGDLDDDVARQTAASLGAVESFAGRLDVTDRGSFESFVSQVEEELGPIDIFVNNAGVMLLGELAGESDEAADLMIDVNLRGLTIGTKLAMERMVPRGRGTIVNIASQAGKTGFPGAVTYCATKHAVVGLSEAARAELRGTGVEICCVMPAVVETELGSGLRDVRGVPKLQPVDVAEAIVAAVQAGRFEVWVPRYLRAVVTWAKLVPRPVAEAIARLMNTDRVLADADMARRREYESGAGQGTEVKR